MLNESSALGGADRGPYVAQQTWRELLFAHWPVAKRAVEARLPAGLTLDLWEGGAWIAVVPFRIEGLRPRMLPGLPTATNFIELNVRTYVRVNDRPGVYFFSLDASSALAVAGARTMYGLPYHGAEMSCTADGEWLTYRSRRDDGGAAFAARYRPTGLGSQAEPGSLEEFLVERYRLFAARDGRLTRVEIDHPPWQLRPAAVEIELNTMTLAAGIPIPDQPPFAHFVERQDVLNGLPIAVP